MTLGFLSNYNLVMNFLGKRKRGSVGTLFMHRTMKEEMKRLIFAVITQIILLVPHKSCHCYVISWIRIVNHRESLYLTSLTNKMFKPQKPSLFQSDLETW